MALDSATGNLKWLPSISSPDQASVVLMVYDTHGGHATQEFSIHVAGANQAPKLDPLPSQILGKEGQLLEIPIFATDPDGDTLIYWVDGLPPGAVFDAE